jgi:hypothetical protein
LQFFALLVLRTNYRATLVAKKTADSFFYEVISCIVLQEICSKLQGWQSGFRIAASDAALSTGTISVSEKMTRRTVLPNRDVTGVFW